MRKALDHLYRGSGVAAAAFLAAIGVVVLLQVRPTPSTPLPASSSPLVRPGGASYAEFAGFFLVAASFLALAYTLRCGAHIRVSMIIQTLTRAQQRAVEVWCTGVGAVLSGYFSVYTVGLIVESFQFHDLSPAWSPSPCGSRRFPWRSGWSC
jgi:TRAP-type C4-dicarboxylate transport system permease small subunit